MARHSTLNTLPCNRLAVSMYSLRNKAGLRLIERASLGQGDTLVVCKLDRLARSTRDLLNTLAAIADAGATFKSLGDPWCDTTSAHGKLMVTVLGGLAEFERHLILVRTTEGRKRAQARGVRFGRKPKLTAHQQREAIARRARGEALVDIPGPMQSRTQLSHALLRPPSTLPVDGGPNLPYGGPIQLLGTNHDAVRFPRTRRR